jgi:hypothetical protein
MWISFRATIWAYNDHRGSEVFQKMPASTGDGKEIGFATDIAKELESGVVLKEKIHFDSDSSNVLEHVGELHIFGI